jgi:ribosomal protein L29
MKKKQIRELHDKTEKELKELIRKDKAELVKLRTDLGAGKLKDTQAVNKKRHEVARLYTILQGKELAE